MLSVVSWEAMSDPVEKNMSDQERIIDAVNLYKASETGRGRRGTARQCSLATEVANMLSNWVKAGAREIEFVNSSEMSSWAESQRNRVGADIRVRLDIRHDVAATAISLLHEGTHLRIRGRAVDQEMICREMELLLYEELLSPGIAYKDHSGTSMRAVLLMGSDFEVELQQQKLYRDNQQLIDWILHIGIQSPEGGTYSNSLTDTWVRSHFDEWGGVSNRWATSLRHFVRVLAPRSTEIENAECILKCLVQVQDHDEYWRHVTEVIGGAAELSRLFQTMAREFHNQRRDESYARLYELARVRIIDLS
jgi:Na+-transporting NADH:ubiquinone oxidoreductase subunit NqrB